MRKTVAREASDVNKFGIKLPKTALYYKVSQKYFRLFFYLTYLYLKLFYEFIVGEHHVVIIMTPRESKEKYSYYLEEGCYNHIHSYSFIQSFEFFMIL